MVRKSSETVYVQQDGKTHPFLIVIIRFDPPLPNNPERHSVMASITESTSSTDRRELAQAKA